MGPLCTCARVARMGRTFCTTHPSRPSLKHKSSPLKSKNICASFRLPGIFRPASVSAKGKYILYVPSASPVVMPKPAPVKSKIGCLLFRFSEVVSHFFIRAARTPSSVLPRRRARKNNTSPCAFRPFYFEIARFNSENGTFNRKNRTFICEIGPFIRPVFSAAGSVRSPAPPRIPIPRR